MTRLLRLTLVNYKDSRRKSARIPVGNWILTELLDPSQPIFTFARSKALILASRRNGYLLASDNKTVERFVINANAKNLRELRDLATEEQYVHFGREFLFWLPHFKELALFTALSSAARTAFSSYTNNFGAVVLGSDVNYEGCPLIGFASTQNRNRAATIKFFQPLVKPLKLETNTSLIPPIADMIMKFRDGYFFDEEFNLTPSVDDAIKRGVDPEKRKQFLEATSP
jgi:hypothetical protein